VVLESGRSPAFLLENWSHMSAIQADIEARLAEAEPEVEVLLAEVVGGRLVRLLLARARAAAVQARPLPPLRRPARARAHARQP
jgi:ribosome maturation factor RimP